MKPLLAIALFVALWPTAISAAEPKTHELEKAVKKVEALFRNLRSVSDKETSSFVADKIRFDFEAYFRSKGQNCPNEFRSIWPQNHSATSLATDIRPGHYVNLFIDMFRDPAYEDCSFSFEPLNSCIVEEPEFKKNEAPAQLAQVIIRKTYLRDKLPFAAFNDTLVVGLEEMKIRAWANDASKHPIGYFGGDVLDVEQLKVSAAFAYNSKQYAKAYQIYQSIVNRFPEEGDPYYRMAVMLYKKNCGRNMNKKERQKLILDYLEKAIRHGSHAISRCADNMRYWLTC